MVSAALPPAARVFAESSFVSSATTQPLLHLPGYLLQCCYSHQSHVRERSRVVEPATDQVFLSCLYTVPRKDPRFSRLVMNFNTNNFFKPLHFKMVLVAQFWSVLWEGV